MANKIDKEKRPLSFTIYSILVWLTKGLPLVAIYFFLDYVNPRLDFYLGLGLRDIRVYLYVYCVAAGLTLICTVFLFFRMAKFLQPYFIMKSIEVHCLLMALPTLLAGLERAYEIQHVALYQISAWTFILGGNAIFPVVYFLYKRHYK